MSETQWRPISEADKTIVDVMEFPEVLMTIRNSAPILARDKDGRTFECVWTDHRGGYWWDLDEESPVDPIEFRPLPSDPSQSKSEIPELKPCPFCGSKFKMGQEPHDNHPVAGHFYIYHDYGPIGSEARKCRLDVKGHFESAEEVVNFWNRRSHPLPPSNEVTE